MAFLFIFLKDAVAQCFDVLLCKPGNAAHVIDIIAVFAHTGDSSVFILIKHPVVGMAFDHDTVTVALELFKRLGLVYQEENGVLRITDSVKMVGHESANREAVKKREYRMRKKLEDKNEDKVGTNCPTEIEIRDRVKSIDINIKEREKEKKSAKRFLAPTVEEVHEYCRERNNFVNPQAFVDFYTAKGWKVGNAPMKDWKAAVRTWEQRDAERRKPKDDGRFYKSEPVEDDLPF